MRNPPVQNMHPVYTVLDCRCTVAQLRQHPAADQAAAYQLLRLSRRQSADKAGLVVYVSVEPLNIR